MILPKELEPLRNKKIWLCYPMIWNAEKHNGVGGYDKPPINPYTLYNGSSDDSRSLATFDNAAAQIGKTARVRVKGYDGLVSCKVVGVGIALSGTGVAGIDLDNVADRERKVMTKEAGEIVELLDTYTELSPSGNGLHILFFGKLPENVKKIAKPNRDIFKTDKAEYQLFDSGYMTVSGESIGSHEIAERTEQVAQMYERYFVEEIVPPQRLSTVAPAQKSRPSVVSCGSGFTYEKWLSYASTLSDAELLERIFQSGGTGKRVEALYNGDMSEYSNDHSRADQALCTFLYGFTDDRATTERLFRSSSLYRATGKSRNYLERTLNKADKERVRLIGHIEFTAAEKKAYAQQKEKEELEARRKARSRQNSQTKKERAQYDRRKI